MKIVLLIPFLILSGCYQVVNKFDVDDATKICESQGGIAEISASFLGDEKVTCRNNRKFFLHTN